MLLYSTWIVTSKQLFTSPLTVVMSCWKAVLLSLYFLLMFYIETLTAKIRKDAVNSLYTMSNHECPLYSISNTWRRNQYLAATKNWLVVIYCTVYLRRLWQDAAKWLILSAQWGLDFIGRTVTHLWQQLDDVNLAGFPLKINTRIRKLQWKITSDEGSSTNPAMNKIWSNEMATL